MKRLIAVFLVLLALVTQTGAVWADEITHVVQRGETLGRIATRYGVSWVDIAAANGIVGDRIWAGQTLVIPGTSGAAPAPASRPNPTHIVQAGETLFTIGLRYGIVWTRIAAANGISGDRVFSGQRLVIPVNAPVSDPQPAPVQGPAPAPQDPAPAPAPSSERSTHVVARGDTLARIANRYGVTWPAIMAINNLPSDRIFPGQSLIIPSADEAASVTPAQVQLSRDPLPGRTGKYFVVDLSEQRLYAFEGQTLVRQVVVSTGRAATPTVIGEFAIWIKLESTRMRGPGYDLANVPYTMYFYKGYGLHGTYWHNNFGTPMSHGCVNLPTPEARWAFHWAEVGTPVIVVP